MPMVFVTGGVRSGKSAYAEQFVHRLGPQLNCNRYVYVATGVATDNEMKKRINRHREDREQAEHHWYTMEAPYSIAEALQNLQLGDIVLWDCLTTWLTNCLYEGYDRGTPCVAIPGCVDVKIARMKASVSEVNAKGIALVIVSNELQDELPYPDGETELYRRYLGELHQWFVSQAKEVYELDYGLIKKWK